MHSFDYDPVDQLLNDTVTVNGVTQHQYSYAYDSAGNRTTEQIDTTVNPASYNNLNQLTSLGGNGQAISEGTLDRAGTVTISDTNTTITDENFHFRLMAPVVAGSNLMPITAIDAYGNTTNQHIQLTVSGNGSQTLAYDANGNLTSDGARTFEWDAANRCVAINQGTHRTEMTYDGLNQRVKIVEKENGNVTSTKQFVWIPGDAQPSEERDGSNNVTKRFYPQGLRVSSTSYYYTKDHLGSIREMTDASGTVLARYDYDSWGRSTTMINTNKPDFNFTGLYRHSKSNLDFATYRAYDPDLGRWLSRDPIAENAGTNLYRYVRNNPTGLVDPKGLDAIVLVVHNVILGQGHIAILVGSNSTGWTYYSRNGYGSDALGNPTGNSVLRVYQTYQDFKNDTGESKRYQEVYYIRTTLNEDLAMATYGDEHYRDPYNTIPYTHSNNCADLTDEILTAGGDPIPGDNTRFGDVQIPNKQFNSLIHSNMGHLWNVYP